MEQLKRGHLPVSDLYSHIGFVECELDTFYAILANKTSLLMLFILFTLDAS